MLGLFEVEVNGHTIVKLGKQNLPSKETPWFFFGFRVPSFSFFVLRRNNLGELERTLAFSFPTIFQISKIEGISWEVHLRILGFGFSVCLQDGY